MTRPFLKHCAEWETVTLEANPHGEVVVEVGSGGTPSTKQDRFWNGSILWLTPKEVTNGSTYRYLSSTERTLTKEGLTKAGRLWEERTVMLTKRAPVGEVVINKVPMATNQGFLSFRCGRKLYPEYLYYWFKGNGPYLDAVANGSTYPELYPLDLFEFEVSLPSLAEQQAIAYILGTLDDKIELNRRMNETLEAMASVIFKSWFVDFDPVRAKAEGRRPAGMNAETANLFPNSFIDSELGKIPRRWKLGCLGDIAENPRHGVNAEEIEPGTPYIGLEHMPRKSIVLSNWGTVEDMVSNKFRFSSGEILFGKLRPYFHKVGVAVQDGVCSTDILVITPKSQEWFGFAISCVSSIDFINYTDAHSTGTKMPRTNWRDMSKYKVILPPAPLAEAFNDITTLMIKSIRNNILESRTLASIRDALLPKLLSGQIRVKDAEEVN